MTAGTGCGPIQNFLLILFLEFMRFPIGVGNDTFPFSFVIKEKQNLMDLFIKSEEEIKLKPFIS